MVRRFSPMRQATNRLFSFVLISKLYLSTFILDCDTVTILLCNMYISIFDVTDSLYSDMLL